jgi:hypothetical protein
LRYEGEQWLSLTKHLTDTKTKILQERKSWGIVCQLSTALVFNCAWGQNTTNSSFHLQKYIEQQF